MLQVSLEDEVPGFPPKSPAGITEWSTQIRWMSNETTKKHKAVDCRCFSIYFSMFLTYFCEFCTQKVYWSRHISPLTAALHHSTSRFCTKAQHLQVPRSEPQSTIAASWRSRTLGPAKTWSDRMLWSSYSKVDVQLKPLKPLHLHHNDVHLRFKEQDLLECNKFNKW